MFRCVCMQTARSNQASVIRARGALVVHASKRAHCSLPELPGADALSSIPSHRRARVSKARVGRPLSCPASAAPEPGTALLNTETCHALSERNRISEPRFDFQVGGAIDLRHPCHRCLTKAQAAASVGLTGLYFDSVKKREPGDPSQPPRKEMGRGLCEHHPALRALSCRVLRRPAASKAAPVGSTVNEAQLALATKDKGLRR